FRGQSRHFFRGDRHRATAVMTTGLTGKAGNLASQLIDLAIGAIHWALVSGPLGRSWYPLKSPWWTSGGLFDDVVPVRMLLHVGRDELANRHDAHAAPAGIVE